MSEHLRFKRIKEDYDRLVRESNNLEISMKRIVDRSKVDKQIKDLYGDEAEDMIALLPEFSTAYQVWYSEACAVIRQLLPDRLYDFQAHYLRPKTTRKDLSAVNYVIEDFIQGLRVTRGTDYVVVDRSSAIPRFEAQIAILKACRSRFESSLYELKQMVQADVMDSEIDSSRELLKNGFTRAAGVVAGVVLEKHIQLIVQRREIAVKNRPALGDYIAALKDADAVSVAEWRKLQYLSEVRAKCAHSKGVEPTADEVAELIAGTDWTIKNLF